MLDDFVKSSETFQKALVAFSEDPPVSPIAKK